MKELILFVAWMSVFILGTVAWNSTIECQNDGIERIDEHGHSYCECWKYHTGKYCETVSCVNCEGRVYDHLFKNDNGHYNPLIRPALKPEDNTTVHVQFNINNLLNIIEIDEVMEVMGFFSLVSAQSAAQIITLDHRTVSDTVPIAADFIRWWVANNHYNSITVYQYWWDNRLTWNPYEFGGVDTLVLPALEVWLPDVVISNTATTYHTQAYKRDFWVIINWLGTVTWEFGGIIETGCDINMSDYPFDYQICEIRLETWASTMYQVDLEVQHLNLITSVYDNSLWNLTSSGMYKKKIYHQGYCRVAFTFTWHRKHLYYYLNIVIPALMLVVVSLGVYWLPSESGEKVSLAVTLLLAFSVFLLIIMDHTPTNSSQIPRITLFVILIMAVTTMSLVVSIFIAYTHGIQQRAPRWLRVIFFNCLAKVMCMKSHLPEDEEVKLLNYNSRPTSITFENLSVEFEEQQKEQKDSPLQNELKGVTKYLGDIIRFLEDKQGSDKIQCEWVAIGRVIDRFCFWVSFVLLLVLFPLIFVGVI